MTPITHEIALRIGLAARMIPDMDAKGLLAILDETIGLPPTQESLATLSVKQLRAAADGRLAETAGETLKGALACLKGAAGGESPLPETAPYAEGDMPDSIRVACASNGGEALDGHFGSCARFLVYQVSADEIRLIDIRRVGEPPEGEEKNAHRANLIGDCQLLLVASIGGPAAAKVVKKGIHPIKHPDGGPARARLEGLKPILKGAPPPWLAKAMGHAPEQRVRFDLAEAEA